MTVGERRSRGWGGTQKFYWNITATVCNTIRGEFSLLLGEDRIRSNVTAVTLMACPGERGRLEKHIMDTLMTVNWLYGGHAMDLLIETRAGANVTFRRSSGPEGLEGPYIYTDPKVSTEH